MRNSQTNKQHIKIRRSLTKDMNDLDNEIFKLLFLLEKREERKIMFMDR